ncbi:hypothetical protein FACS1894105_08890 [Clostridia bacterium]|nr:hypothetical protein FACS1894105_08890 [Clostridia bacterium]
MKKAKLLSSILALTFVIFPLAACQTSNDDKDASENGSTTGAEQTTAAATIDRPAIPDGTDYGGYEFKVLAKHSEYAAHAYTLTENEVFAEEENSEPLNDAVYKRNRKVETLLNVTIKSVDPGKDTVAFARKAVQTGDNSYDALCVRDYDNIDLLRGGNLVNLYSVPNIDLSKSWWDDKQVEEITYKNNKIYFVQGDINWYDDYGVMVLYFNKRLFQENGLDYPYDKVLAGKWTIDEFSTLVKGFTRDINGDGVLNQDDQWGMLENGDCVYHFIIGGGETISSLDSGGMPTLNALTERHLKVVETLGNLFSDKNSVLLAGNGQMKGVSDEFADGIFKVFKDGRGLFLAEMVGSIPNFRDMEDDFGFLPQPKLDEAQKEYAGFTSGGWSSSYSVPVSNQELARTGMILEAMAGYSTDTIRPALFDASLKSKFARDNESEKMLDIIFSSKKYDWGERFRIGDLYGAYQTVAKSGFGSFVSNVEKMLPRAQTALEKLIVTLDDLN